MQHAGLTRRWHVRLRVGTENRVFRGFRANDGTVRINNSGTLDPTRDPRTKLRQHKGVPTMRRASRVPAFFKVFTRLSQKTASMDLRGFTLGGGMYVFRHEGVASGASRMASQMACPQHRVHPPPRLHAYGCGDSTKQITSNLGPIPASPLSVLYCGRNPGRKS